MRKNVRNLGLTLAVMTSLSFTNPLSANTRFKIDAFDYLALGMDLDTMVAKSKDAPCDAPADIPGFKGSSAYGLTSTVCPLAQTFGMATLYNKKVASLVLNWVSWDASQLDGRNSELAKMPTQLRQHYGIPAMTLSYERQFGNSDADRFCREKATCKVHIWKSSEAERVASLVYAKVNGAEVPLIFNLTDVAAEREIVKLKETVRAHVNNADVSKAVAH